MAEEYLVQVIKCGTDINSFAAELNFDVLENKYSKYPNFKTNKDFSFKFGLNVSYILQNVLITLTLAIAHQVHVLLN